jgi:integrase
MERPGVGSPWALLVLPKLGKVPVADIDQTDIRDTLAPIWHTKADTAKKALNRLGICLTHAAALGLDVDLQAAEKAKALLGRQRHKVRNVPSVPWPEMPALDASPSDGSIPHLALRLLILTGVRSGDNRPSQAPGPGGLPFPGVKKGVISDMTMGRLMERMGVAARPHGFRSSLRNWLAEATDAPHEVVESCLAHVVGGTVQRACRRTDYLDQRRVLMARWAKQVTGQDK